MTTLFGIFLGGLMALIVGLIIFAFVNVNAFKKLFGVAQAHANAAADAAEDASRIALVKNEIENDKLELKKSNDARVAQLQRVTTAKRIMDKWSSDVEGCRKRIDTATTETAKLDWAKKMNEAKNNLVQSTQNYELESKKYENFKYDCEKFEKNIKDNEFKVEQAIQANESAKASAAMAERMAPAMASSGSDVNRHLEALQKNTDKYNAKASVANERNAEERALDEENRRIADQEAKALLDQIEAENKAKRGMDDLFPNVKEQA